MDTTKQTLKLFWQSAWRYPRYVIPLLIGIPTTILVWQFLPPLIVANVLNKLGSHGFDPHNPWATFGNDTIWYAILVIFGSIVAWRIVIVLIWRLEANVLRDLAQRSFSHIMSLDANFHSNNFGGSLVSQAGKLQTAYVRIADTVVFEIATLLVAFAATAVILAPIAPLFVALLLVFSVAYLISAFFITRRVRQLNSAESQAQNAQTGMLADSITNIMAVKSFAAHRAEQTRYNQAAETTRHATLALMRGTVRREIFFGSITASIQVLAFAMAVVGVTIFKSNLATTFLILSYTGTITQYLWEFSQNTLRNLNRALGEARDMVHTFNLQPSVQDPAKPEAVRITKGAIVFDDVTFAHADTTGDALFKNLALSIKAGEKIGLVGHSGSGKTTLTRLLLRFSDVDAGQITIDGQNIAHILQDDLRAYIAYVPQEPLLFHRSIRENIAYGMPGASEAQIKAAAKKANAAEFIQHLPQGYDTLVGERGVKLSGGQRQRVAIARSILKDAPILVLDEATSALDSESELLIQAALQQLMSNRTAIVIAHRLSTIQKMDRIVVLADGKIVEQGTHAELLAQKGAYAKLWAHQSGGFIED